MAKESYTLGDGIILIASEGGQTKLERKDRVAVNVRIDRGVLEKLRAVAFSASNPQKRVSVADIIRAELDKSTSVIRIKGK